MKKIKILAIVLVVACLLMSLVACAKDKKDTGTKDPKILVMGTNAAFPPFEFMEGGQVVGVDAEMMALIAAEMGMELKIVDLDFEALPAALANGQIDIIAAGLTVRPDREETMDFTNTYYTAAQTVIVLKDSGYTGIADLSEKLIGVQTGTTGSYCAEEFVDDLSQIKTFQNGMLAVEALKNGQVDAVIIDNNPAKEYAEIHAELSLIEGEFADEMYAMAVAKGNQVLLDNVNAALVKIRDNGEFDKIIDKYVK